VHLQDFKTTVQFLSNFGDGNQLNNHISFHFSPENVHELKPKPQKLGTAIEVENLPEVVFRPDFRNVLDKQFEVGTLFRMDFKTVCQKTVVCSLRSKSGPRVQ